MLEPMMLSQVREDPRLQGGRPERRTGVIENLMNALSGELDGLEGDVERLVERLRPVLLLGPPSQEKCLTESPPCSTLAGCLGVYQQRVMKLRRDMRALEEGCEL